MIEDKLITLRNLFPQYGINGYIISTRDEYLSEYPPAYAKRLEYLTGFTGSNGLAVILEETVLFFTDGRYTNQARLQLDKKLFQVFDQKFLDNFPFEDHITGLKSDKRGMAIAVAYDPKIFTNNMLLPFKTFDLKVIENNFIDQIWKDQPPRPNSEIYSYDIKFAGQSSEEKLVKCRKFIAEQGADSLLITNPEAVCWLLNVRASDIEFSPLLLAHALITKDAEYIFTNCSRSWHGPAYSIQILPPESLKEKIQDSKGIILFDDSLCSKYLADIIMQQPHKIIPDPCILWKACKNEVEINGMIEGHVQDGIAVCEFLAFLVNNDLSHYSEYDLGVKLTDFRAKGKNYVCDSFPAIIGFQDNGAVIHYRALAHSAKKIQGDGLLLIDSGGQYLGATTDITRVISVGQPKPKYKKYYTKILKGHLALAMARFPMGMVCGANLDILARQFLWQEGDDYAHGTGHGVGSFLSVHEGPQNISLNSYQTKFAIGMVVSNEPGFYKSGEFGIRIENLMYVAPAPQPSFLEFQMLTLVPYSKELIEWSMLSSLELAYIKYYYSLIREKILPYLSNSAQKWLSQEINI